MEATNFLKAVLIITAVILFVIGCASIPAPVKSVDSALHPNLAAAQDFIIRAFAKITSAQNANEFDLGGHARKAKILLDQANDEIKLAALAANK